MKLEELERASSAARSRGAQTVVVVGLGFVGTAVAANLSRVDGRRAFFVIGLDRDDEAGRAKAASLDRGEPPCHADDPALATTLRAAAESPRNIAGTVELDALAQADLVVVCINLDLVREPGQVQRLSCAVDGCAAVLREIGRRIRPGTLVSVESTLPLGASDVKLYPALCLGAREAGRDVDADPPLYAYCYERVMPGPKYLESVNSYWRAFAGIDERSAESARRFLERIVDTDRFPLWRHKQVRAAEMAKLLENTYRAVNIALVDEWARLAEAAGVDLFDVIASIRLRRGTHDNLMSPGLGVGGYCLTKDALLAAWGAEELLAVEAALPFARQAILTNERMPLRAFEALEAHFQGQTSGKRVALLGVTYRPEVADTRSSPSEILARRLLSAGATVLPWDPLVTHWEELPLLAMAPSAAQALEGADAAVICIPDRAWTPWLAALLAGRLAPGALVVDPWNLAADALAPHVASGRLSLFVYGRGDLRGPSAP